MKRSLHSFLMLLASFAYAVAADSVAAPQITWEGYKAKAASLPVVSNVSAPEGTAGVRVEVTAPSPYQGAAGKFAEEVDLSKYSAVEFYIRHNITSQHNGRLTFSFMFFGKLGNIHCQFVTPSNQWSKISVPLDRSSFESGQTGNSVNMGKMHSFRIAPFGSMDEKGEFLEIADFKLIPKTSGTRPIKVMSYVHKNKPTSGENGTTLTDGDKSKNVFFRQYSDEPIITFDLGGRFAIDELRITANCAPSHNFSEITIFTSFDNKEFVPAGSLRNHADGTAVREITYSFKSTGKPVVGRYVRLQAERPRTDFPVNLAEVEFFGHTPSEAEIIQAAELNYDTGVKMPARNDKDYVVLRQNDYKLYISRSNGVINGVFYKDKLIVERMTPAYTLQTRKTDTAVSGNQDKVISIEAADGKVVVVTRNDQLPDLEFKRTWYVVGNALYERVEITDLGMKERKFLRIATGVILEQQFRKNGFYEMPGSALAVNMFRLHSSEVQMDRAMTNIPTLAFENAETCQTIWHTRIKFNERLTYMDVGTEEDNLQIFRPNGWLITGASIVPLDRKVHTFENRFSVTEGSMLKAFDEYLAVPEVAAFRSKIQRPAWLRDVRCTISQGWDASYPGSSDRHFRNMVEAFSHRGYLIEPGMFDMDGHWGDWLTSGMIYSGFGGQASAEELQQKIDRYRSYSPNIKAAYYTWAWSAFPWSTPVKNHPEWFVKTLRSGAPASWFPGVNVNYLRFFGIKESRDEAADQIVRFINFYKQDNWYLDGGKSGSYAKCFDTMRIDDPLGWTDFYIDVRQRIKETDPERIVFFNHCENPLGDMGFVECLGGTLTNEWRRGAILMWKFRMYSHKDPLHHSIYIYWIPALDGAFHNYMCGIGTLGSYSSRDFTIGDLPYIAARYEIRQAQMADAAIRPDWRLDVNENVECMALYQGNNGWIFINPHDGKPVRRNISALTAPMNIKDKTKPVYAWIYTIKDGKNYKGTFSEQAVAAEYKKHGWISERAVVPQYLGKFPWTERFALDVELNDRAKVLMLTQVPAVVLSIESEPAHYYLAGQPGIELDGGNGNFEVNSEYDTAEIGLMLEPDTVPAGVKVNGRTVKAALRIENNMRFAVVTVGKGKSVIAMTTQASAPLKVEKLLVQQRGRSLAVQVVPENAVVEVYCDGNLVMNRTGSFQLPEMPSTVSDGVYTFKAGELTEEIEIRKVGKPMKLRPILITLKEEVKTRNVDRTVNNIKVYSQGTLFNPGTSYAQVDVPNLKLTAGFNRIYENHHNRSSAMLELQLKRYVKVRMVSGFHYYNNFGMEAKRHSVRYSLSHVFGGLVFDFNTPQGYTVRSTAGLGIQNEKRSSARPDAWGKKEKHDHIYALDNILVNEKVKEKTCWIDLNLLGAPVDWNGRTMVTLHFEDICPARSFELEILETADQLPAGNNVLVPAEMGVSRQAVLDIKKVSGKPDWQKIPVLGGMTPVRSTMTPLKTIVKAAWDDKNLYIHYQAFEIKDRILNCEGGKSGKPWLGDGVEFFVQRTDQPEMVFHALSDVGKICYNEDITLLNTAGGKNIIHPRFGFDCTFDFKPDQWTAEIVMPWSTIGGKPALGELRAFNAMRTRLEQGKYDFYTLAPNTQYFTGKQYQFKLVK